MTKRHFIIYHIILVGLVVAASYLIFRPKKWGAGIHGQYCYYVSEMPKSITRPITFYTYKECKEFTSSK